MGKRGKASKLFIFFNIFIITIFAAKLLQLCHTTKFYRIFLHSNPFHTPLINANKNDNTNKLFTIIYVQFMVIYVL